MIAGGEGDSLASGSAGEADSPGDGEANSDGGCDAVDAGGDGVAEACSCATAPALCAGLGPRPAIRTIAKKTAPSTLCARAVAVRIDAIRRFAALPG